ncbi:TetR/AcrR family transcriptional regulator [Roseibium salinum]|uniref:TetR/AcrR family transcriptional regulator n=1 Tax=Roseibium salinum TaxID=1604349 RepID=A0ABT3R7L7_9HYPH|nr:TetR/AcrR family transcriptional regulator [Roseibium sp. DSM 29163]MCX2725128.1 TetR/AcrR family transcriptional regulator [Roseibium sp. DSM 29163]MDN3720990.1 TetR/AcrR family transcriptional regulator [Roseibium salinum]
MTETAKRVTAKDKLLAAALKIVRAKGYAATNIDEICAEAGVTKGGFFHHFKSKEDWAVAAAAYWSQMTGDLFEKAPYHEPEDPLQRVLAYIAFRKDLLSGELAEFTCLLGTMVQETYGTSPAIRAACWEGISSHADTLVPYIQAAMDAHGIRGDWTAQSLALHTQAVLQGAFILAKASEDPQRAAESVDHLYRYVELLFADR